MKFAAIFGFAILALAFTFDGAPSAPLAYTSSTYLNGWDVQIHDQSIASGNEGALLTFDAEHGDNCSAPPATHTVTSRNATVFQCSNHVMTSLEGNYGVIYLTPNRLLNLTQERVITFSMSTNKASARDWPDFTISNYADFQSLPLLSDLSQGVDLQGPTRNSVVITTDNAEGAPNLKVVRNGNVTSYPQNWPPLDVDIPATVNQSVVREPFKITISPTRVRFERLPSTSDPNGQLFFDTTIPALNFTEAVFTIGHHSYNPWKDCSNSNCVGTWHWDDVEVEGTEFYIERLATNYVSGSASLNYSPAPTGAKLKFSAMCRPVINGVALTKITDTNHPEHTSSYSVDIPAGSTAVGISFTNDSWYTTGLGCHAKDFAVWAKSNVVPTPTPTPAPTPTPTPTYRCQIQNSNGSYTTLWRRAGGGACP